MQLNTIPIEKPDATNFILGQTHFIKSVEDIYEALVTTVPGIQFGLAFNEASGKCLVRSAGSDPRWLRWPRRTPWRSAPGTFSSSSLAKAITPSTS